MKRQLILEDGNVFIGNGFGADRDISGEVVFNTGMTGYQEVLSDPSYCGQIITMTYPLIGNYGINRDDFESITPALSALIVKEASTEPNHWRSEQTIDELLKEKNIPGLEGVDTRKLTRLIRQHGTMKGKICSMNVDTAEIAAQMRQTNFPTDQVAQVSTKTPYASPGTGRRIVLYDFGMKKGILRECNRRQLDVMVVPHDTPAEEVMKWHPDGVLLSNGPGDPKDVPQAVEAIKELIGRVPIFGICLGHQIIALACGGNTKKMKFGHRGANHPVKSLSEGNFFITSQNHGYTVDEESLQGTNLESAYVAVNDGTIEGLNHIKHPVFSVQFHPEASPGPHDSEFLFDRFLDMMKSHEKEGLQYA